MPTTIITVNRVEFSVEYSRDPIYGPQLEGITLSSDKTNTELFNVLNEQTIEAIERKLGEEPQWTNKQE